MPCYFQLHFIKCLITKVAHSKPRGARYFCSPDTGELFAVFVGVVAAVAAVVALLAVVVVVVVAVFLFDLFFL